MVENKAATAKQPPVTKKTVVAKPVVARSTVVQRQAAAQKQPRDKIGIGRLLGMVGGILVLVGALLPWAVLSGGRLASPQTFLGIQTGFFGVLVVQLGFFGIVMMLDGKKTTSLGGLIMGAAGMTFSALSLLALNLLSLGNTSGIDIEVSAGVYVCVVGSIILLVGSLLAMIEASKPRKTPLPPAKLVKKGKPIEAYVLFVVTLVGAILLLIYPWTYGRLDAVGAIYFLYGVVFAPSSYYVFKVEYWTWGTLMIMMVLILLFAVLASTLVLLAYADALALVLFYTQSTYGVGVWKVERAREEEQKKVREVLRTANPEGLHCPRCRSTDVYICDDGSTYCRSCKTGFVNIRDASAKPRSSMQGV